MMLTLAGIFYYIYSVNYYHFYFHNLISIEILSLKIPVDENFLFPLKFRQKFYHLSPVLQNVL